MPKIVDHEQRRHDLAEALWRVIAGSGPGAVSVRSVAAEAGMSPGALRHYFQTREQLLVFAMELSEARVTERIVARQAEQDPDTPMVERAAGFVEELVPLDDLRRAEFRAWEAAGLLGEEDRDRQARWDKQRLLYRQVVGSLAGQPMRDPSQAHPDPWVEEWVGHLHAFVDGLALQLMVTPGMTDTADVRQRLRSFLGRIEQAHHRAADD